MKYTDFKLWFQKKTTDESKTEVWKISSSLAKGYDSLPLSSPLADWDNISETQGKDFYWLQ